MKHLFITRGQGEFKSHQAKITTKSGKFFLSIVAGFGCYSTPREYQKDGNYSNVELAIFTIDGDWADKDQVSPVFPIIGRGEYSCWEDGFTTVVFPFVPIGLIKDVIEIL